MLYLYTVVVSLLRICDEIHYQEKKCNAIEKHFFSLSWLVL